MSDPHRPLVGRRILVVEDEYLIAMEVEDWLLAAGAEVIGPVARADQAFDLIEDDGISAAVLDVNLGDGGTVYPVADRLNELSVPYLFATGEVKVSEASEHRDRPVLKKPYLKGQLVQAVVMLLS